MITLLSSALDRFRGSGDAAVTIPSMDGAFRPNNRLETAATVLSINAPDNLAQDGNRVLFSSNATLYELRSGNTTEARPIEEFEAPITAVGGHLAGIAAIGLAKGEITIRGGRTAGRRLTTVGGRALRCPTVLHFLDADTLLVCLGSQENDPTEWRRDLLDGNTSGSVWRIDLASGHAHCLLDRLAWPGGATVSPDGKIVIAEAWRHRLIDATAGEPYPLMAEIPGYPGRIIPASNGDYWLSIFAPRSQLFEFVLREPLYRSRMMSEIKPEFWVAPSLHSARDYREPLQAGAIRRLGELKPWAPSRSYGLIARLDAGFGGIESFHSRADGRRHGITSSLETGGRILATSKGGDEIFSLDLGPVQGSSK